MSSTTSITELRSMQISDLHREVRSQQTQVRKMRLQISMKIDKDTARYRREKRQLTRMLMVLGEKMKETKDDLNQKPKNANVSARLRPASPGSAETTPRPAAPRTSRKKAGAS